MPNDAGAQGTLIDQVLAAMAGSSDQLALSRELFARILLDALEAEGVGLDPDQLAREVVTAFDFLRERRPGEHKIRSRACPGGGSILEILNDDMPFLVDSLAGEVRARGLSVRYLLHPIVKVERRTDGTLVRIIGAGDRAWADGSQESFITMVLPDLASEDAGELVATLSAILKDVRHAVTDWRPMLQRLSRAISDLSATSGIADEKLREESLAFLKWIEDGQFTFLGMRDFKLSGDPETGELVAVDGAGLGLLRNPDLHVLRRGTELVAMTPEVRRFFFQPSPLIITKANVVSRIHRRVHMDYVGVKQYAADGKPAGELRIIGLFTSQAYVQSPRRIPFLRHKAAEVIERSGFPPASHDAKALINVLETFPRDELFQIPTDELQRWTEGILDLELRPRVRVFARADRFDRFVSLLVFAPRDRYNTDVRERIGAHLAEVYKGRIVAFYPYFTEGPLVRVQFIVARTDGPTPIIPGEDLEQAVREIVRTWDDRLSELLLQGAGASRLNAQYVGAFPGGYRERFTVTRALEDIHRIERLGQERPMAIDFYSDPELPPHRVRAAIYRFDEPIRLSERVPVLENLGFSVIDERSYTIASKSGAAGRTVILHDMDLEVADGRTLDLSHMDQRLEECFRAVFDGRCESDPFNRLVLIAGADWREAALMRAYASYLRQLGSHFGPRYIADTLCRHPDMARDLIDLFHARLDPDRHADVAARMEVQESLRQQISAALGNVASLDEDRILGSLLALVGATLRTNYYQRTSSGDPPETIALKLDTRSLEMAPHPRPYREIFVASPRVEAVHLRFAPIARGGIRWSDRAQDFRTEVLGLAKAQQVKNAVIVPSGSKGGFVPKRMPRGGSREQIQAEGIAAYTVFISAMLDITDNLRDGTVVPPERVVRHDGDDPYLVVAADKGTATFSDTANGIATAHGFWLGDAFASGGSVGYDHKKMGITARGAWECVKRHFRELDVDIQATSFRVTGIGDMSGDVFGNGMLLSPAIKLVAAFDHRDIFIDPDPDPGTSIAERQRLFALPRSSWQDYDKSLISTGGGVFPRSSKAIPVSPQIRDLLGLAGDTVTPADLMRAILVCDTDLLWFGGIGTYIRATTETDADVGDRANDPIRVAAAEVKAKVIGEGANLGLTQRARVELSMRGGRLNTDFIDNSAGVNSSDQEVNIKIALARPVASGRLTLVDRNELLTTMTEDVAQAVLRNNYQQSLALSLAEQRSLVDHGAYGRLMNALEARGDLERSLDALPTAREMAERQTAGRPLVRPELAVLLSRAKIALLHDLLATDVPDARVFEPMLMAYFPPALRERYDEDLKQHRLRREIIATSLTNAIVNRLGPATALRLADETARPIADVAKSFVAARDVLGLTALWQRIDALDGRIGGATQLELYGHVQSALVRSTAWFLVDGKAAADLTGTIAAIGGQMGALVAELQSIAGSAAQERSAARAASWQSQGVPADVARDVVHLGLAVQSLQTTDVAAASGKSVTAAARVLSRVRDAFRVDDLLEAASTIRLADDYDRLAAASGERALTDAARAIALVALAGAKGPDGLDGLEAWTMRHSSEFARTQVDLADIAASGALTPSRLTVAAARLSELARLA